VAKEGQPPSRRIADELRARINRGELEPGTKLPSERELAQLYAAARNTAREAIGILANEGLVDVQHGRGAFVRTHPPLLLRLESRYSRTLREETGLSPYRAEVTRQGRTPNVECRSIKRVQPPGRIADRLGVRADAKSVVRRENWYFSDGDPVQVGITFIPWRIASGSVLARQVNMGPGSIYARLEELGHQIARAREEVNARMPTPEEGRGLAIPPGVPVIEVMHTSYDREGRPFEVTQFVMRADLSGLEYTFAVED
jgi:GntR family transcriptional regulator